MNSDLANINVYGYKLMKIYKISFKSMSDLHLYLKSEPTVNNTVFIRQHSILGDGDFAGEPYEKALEYCLGGYEGDRGVTLKMQRELEKYIPIKAKERRKEKSFAGSHPNVPAFVAGSPKAMYRLQRAEEKKFRTVYFNLAYPVMTSQSAIVNRGALTLSLIKLLEAQGMGVDLKVFMTVFSRSEIFMFDIILKAPQELLNSKKCCYPLCSREFVRRLVFRVMESMPFENAEWYPNYGEALTDTQFRSIFGISKNDTVISTPEEMGVLGEDILEDGARLFRRLGLDDTIVPIRRLENVHTDSFNTERKQ